MRFLALPEIVLLNARINGVDAGSSVLYSRVEVYDCVRSGDDRRLFKSLDKQYEELSSSPIFRQDLEISPFGSLLERTPRATFITLISTLNACFPDYDFSAVQPEQFTKENNYKSIVNYINNVLGSVVINDFADFSTKLWNTLDGAMKISDCEIYSFLPEPDADPFGEEGNIWCFNYFFVNKKLCRVMFFMSRSVSKKAGTADEVVSSASEPEDDPEWGWSMEMDEDKMDM